MFTPAADFVGEATISYTIADEEGLTDSVVAAVDSALSTHELIKVKLNQNSLEDKNDVAAALSERLEALLVQRIGKTIILYRERPPEE